MNLDSSIGLDLVLKIALFPMAAGLLSLALRRRSASLQHLMLLAGMVALIALPALAFYAPTWGFAELPGAPEALVRWTTVEAPEGPAFIGSASAAGEPGSFSLVSLLALAWVSGLLTVASRWLTSQRRSYRVMRDATTESSPRLLGFMNEACERLEIRREVTLLRGGDGQMPFTAGTLKQRVLLPADAEQWSDERLRMVLSHELSHVRRLDVLAQHVAALASALYWFHPMVWWMSRRLRATAERAADDGVLRSGASAPDYAEELVLLARQYRGPLAGTPAVTGAPFEERLEALLANGRRRVSLGTARSGLALGSALVLALAVSACARTEAEPAKKTKKEAQAASEKTKRPSSGRQILINAVIVETKEVLVDWDELGDAARGDTIRLVSIGDDTQTLEERLQQGERDGKLKILSAPKILTMDGDEASAQSGLQIPIQTTKDGNITTQFVNATLRLDIRPVIVDDDVVQVEIQITKRFPRLELAENGVNAPISTTEARAKFKVRLGGTVVIAGMRDSSQDSGEDLIAFVTVSEIEV